MPPRSSTADVFSAIAEPCRRRILQTLSGHDHAGLPVGELVRVLRLPQSAVSKHLAVLRSVGLVALRREGRERHYRLVPKSLKPVHDWTALFAPMWDAQLQRIKQRAENAATHACTPPRALRSEKDHA